jgi:hypothetical protein
VDKVKRLSFQASFEAIEDYNPQFLRTRIKVFAFGVNRNNSKITPQAFEKAKNTIFNIPVVAKYTDENDKYGEKGDLEGHNTYLTTDDDGNWIIKTDTYPIGVVSTQANITYEEVNEGTEENPDIKTYVVVDNVFLWKRYEATQKIQSWLEQGIVPNVSMEIDEIEGHYSKDEGCFVIESFIFSAICALGSNVEPCFPKASIEQYSHQTFEDAFYEMLKQLKASLEKGGDKMDFEDKSGEKIEIDNSKESAVMDGSWGDVDKTKLRKEIVAASNAASLVKEAYLIVDEGWEDAPSESLHYPHHVIKDGKLVVHKEGVEAAYARLMQNDPNNEKAIKHIKKHYKELGLDMSNFELEGGKKVDKKEKIQQLFSLSQEQLEDGLIRELAEIEMMQDPYWEDWSYPRFDFVDYYIEEKIVVAYDYKDNRLVGFAFDVYGDNVEVDPQSAKPYKITYEPMDIAADPDNDGDAEVKIITFKMMEMKLNRSKEEFEKKLNDSHVELGKVQTEFSALQEKYVQLESEANELKEFKLNVVKQQREQAEKEIFERFSSLLSEDEIAEVKSKASEMELDAIENTLFALVGKKSANFSMKQKPQEKPIVVPVFEDTIHSDKEWADIVLQYSKK